MIRTQYWKKIFILIILIFIYTSSIFAFNRDQWTRPEKVMDVIGVKEGMKIGIVGAGRGYFTFKMSKRVGNKGKIFANEINSGKLEYIRNKYKREGITNITTILGEIDDPLFPERDLNMIFMCYVFHHLEKPVPFMNNLKKYLEPGATVVILEQEPLKTGSSHFLKKEVILKNIKDSDFKILKTEDFLKKDNIYICIPESEN
ncbi:MAG: class I SAM-dependent methyltransferase [Acidobacteriota bacterium]